MKTHTWQLFTLAVAAMLAFAVPAYAGDTTYDQSVSVSDTAPTVDNVGDPGTVALNEGGTKTVTVQVNVTDSNGADDVTSVNASASATGEATRTDASCTDQGDVDGDTAKFQCTLNFKWYDGGTSTDAWTLTVYAEDSSGNQVQDTSRTFEMAVLDAYNITQTPSWSTLTPGSTDNQANQHLKLNNTGNQDYTTVDITAQDLTDGSGNTIGAGEFEVDEDSGFSTTDTLVSNSAVTVSGASLNAGVNNVETVYHRVDVPASTPAGTYTSSSAWQTSLS